MQKLWRVLPHDSHRVESLIQTAKLPAVVAQLLVCRGVYHADDAKTFLDWLFQPADFRRLNNSSTQPECV